jgi:hypothetical protein
MYNRDLAIVEEAERSNGGDAAGSGRLKPSEPRNAHVFCGNHGVKPQQYVEQPHFLDDRK